MIFKMNILDKQMPDKGENTSGQNSSRESFSKINDYLKLIAENTTDLLAILDNQLTTEYTTTSFEKSLGYQPVVNRPFSDLIHPEEKDTFFQAIADSKKTENLKINLKLKHTEGHFRLFDVTIMNIKRDGECACILISCHDITEQKKTETALIENEKRFSSIIENSDAGYFFLDKNGFFREVNNAWVKLYKYNSKDEIIGKHFTVVQKLDDLENAREFVEEILKNNSDYLSGEFSRKCKDGSTGYHTFSARPVYEHDEAIGIEGFIIDSTARKKTEKALQKSEEKFRALFESMTEGVALHEFIYDESGEPIDYKIANVNPAYFRHTGIEKDIPLGKKASELYGTNSPPYIDIYKKVASTGTSERFEVFFEPMGKYFDISVFSLGKGRFATAFEDISERKKTEEELKKTITEKETLLRELYHRTKNNMQVICSMMRLQENFYRNKKLAAIFHEMENRIYTMSLVHQKLYQSQNLSSINIREYTFELTELLKNSYIELSKNIKFQINVDEILVLIDHAIPYGLVLNELVTNSFKHAFINNMEGKIEISFKKNDDNHFLLNYSDNGIGLPEGIQLRSIAKMGMQTIFAIIEYQLSGEVKVFYEKGLSFSIKFKDSLYNKRI